VLLECGRYRSRTVIARRSVVLPFQIESAFPYLGLPK